MSRYFQVKIHVQDLNDNPPQFIYPETSKRFKKKKYYGAVAKDRKEIGGSVLQVKVNNNRYISKQMVIHKYRLITSFTKIS